MKKVFLRIIAIILVLEIMLPLFANAAMLSTDVINEITVGDNVKVIIETQNPVETMQFDLKFDNSKYQYIGVDSKLKYTYSNLIAENIVRVSAMDLDGKKINTLTLEFKSIEEGQSIPFTVQGTIELGKAKESLDELTVTVTSKKAQISQNTTVNTITNTNTSGNTNTGANTNTSGNTNTGANTNTSGNTNTGTNTNTSGNTNTGTNTNTSGNTNTGTNTNTSGNTNIGTNINTNNQYINEDGEIIRKLPQTGNETLKTQEVQSIGVYTKLISGKIVVPYALKNSDTIITVEDITKEFGQITTTATNPVKTGDTFTLNNEEYTIIIYGDFNKDGKITTLDALEIGTYNSNLDNKIQLKAADVISDGTITQEDAKAVQQFIIGNGKIIDNAPNKIIGITTDNTNVIDEEMSIKLYTNNTNKAQQESDGLLYTIIPIKLIDEKKNTLQLLFGDIKYSTTEDGIGKVSVIEINEPNMSFDLSIIGYVSDGQGGYNEERTSTSQKIDAIGIAINTNRRGYSLDRIRGGISIKYDSIDQTGKTCRKQTTLNVEIDESNPQVQQTVQSEEYEIQKSQTNNKELEENTTNTNTNTNNTSNTTNKTSTNNTVENTNTNVNNTIIINTTNTTTNKSNTTNNIITQENTIKKQETEQEIKNEIEQ